MTAEFQMDGSPLQDSTLAAGLLNSTASMTTDGYDSRGAAMFTIAVILTYTLSIICLIASFSFQKKRAIQQDQEATNYLKYRNEVPRVMSQIEVDQARHYGMRCITDARIPMPFLLVPVNEGRSGNLLAMARAEEEILRLDGEICNRHERKTSESSDVSNSESQASLRIIQSCRSVDTLMTTVISEESRSRLNSTISAVSRKSADDDADESLVSNSHADVQHEEDGTTENGGGHINGAATFLV